MKLSVRGEYALRAMQLLAERYGGPVVSIQTLSDEQNIPKRFLEQILNDLKSSGLVESRRGMAGGYRLALAPAEIPLARIIRYIDGALSPVSCVSERFYEKCSCPDETRCALRSVMKEVRDTVAQMMEKTTLVDLIARAQKLRSVPMGPMDFVI
ncbi:MAG: Rrf2 family transcriptional regulator [Pedosphaera sp.]|nr:Rrf2 family transcriptional regulator [Pedosphaera sp.]